MPPKQVPFPLQTLLLKYQVSILQTGNPQHSRQMFALMNSIAMHYAKEGYLEKALDFLHKSQKYARKKHNIQLKSNIACVLMKLNRYEEAIEYLKDAEHLIEKEKTGPERDKLESECCMNLCAILSAIKQHSKALQMIRRALKITRKTVAKYSFQSGKLNAKKELQPHIIAQYNQAAELQHLNRFEQALWGYEDCKKWLTILQKECQTSKCKKLEQKISVALKAMKQKVRETKRSHCSRSSCYQIENKHSQQLHKANNGNIMNVRARVSLNPKRSIRDEFATLDVDRVTYSSVKINSVNQQNYQSHLSPCLHLNPVRNRLISRAQMKFFLESEKATLNAPLRQANNPLYSHKPPIISIKPNHRYSMDRKQKEN